MTDKKAPAPIRKIEDILRELNGPSLVGDWIRISGYVGVSDPAIVGNQLNFLAPSGGVLCVLFVNTKTAELKFYLAKVLDIPEREQLWQ